MSQLAYNQFENLIDAEINSQIEKLKNFNTLFVQANYHFQKKGSRMLPKISYSLLKSFNIDIKLAVIITSTIEIFHNFTLVHDDIIDEDYYRRGQKSVWAKFSINEAIVLGDCINTMAYDELIKLFDFLPQEISRKIVDYYNQYTLRVYQGECYDIQYMSDEFITEEDSIRMNRLKSGSTIAAIFYLLSFVSGEFNKCSLELEEIGFNIGTALQIKNDIISYISTENRLSDYKKKKKTLPYLFLIENSSLEVGVDNSLIDRFLGEVVCRAESLKNKAIGILEKMQKDNYMTESTCSFLSEKIKTDFDIITYKGII